MDFPILSSLILLPSVGAIFIFFSKSRDNKNISSKYIALFVSVDTIYPMECEFIPKFQKWKPIKIVDENLHTISLKKNLPISV